MKLNERVDAYQYLPNLDFDTYYDVVKDKWPWVSNLIDVDGCDTERRLVDLSSVKNEFEENEAAGRGDSYRDAMRNTGVRSVGMSQLLQKFSSSIGNPLVLDILGGDGELARVAASEYPHFRVLTSDLAGRMIESAMAQEIPAIRQSAEDLLLLDGSVDGVLIAYGTHHIDPEQRKRAYAEGLRVLVADGSLVVHDFAPDSCVATWFREVVHPSSPAGHDYVHLSADQLTDDLTKAGAKSISISEMYDPFICEGTSVKAAIDNLGFYLRGMYGLTASLSDDQILERAREIFVLSAEQAERWHVSPNISVEGKHHTYRVTLPRVALVATAFK
ncbi:class I SAM-dependent methyltransferase (plasmid) [Glutamicibacter sp. FR1]|uniref:class I SAM-dependent methyltransferase n=1 Tax=Glutamicibacter sp. FR1 TaxID=3393744 RepID=UPI0039AEB954